MVGGARPYFGPPSALVFSWIFAAIFLAACRKEEQPPAPPPAAKPDFRAGLPQGLTLDAQLAAEAAARSSDPDTITLERLSSALSDAGIGLGSVRQVMAKHQVAIFCATGEAADGVNVTVCEYPSPEAAVNGEREANVFASKVAGHLSRVRKKSVLHLIKKSTTPDATVEKILAAFDAG